MSEELHFVRAAESVSPQFARQGLLKAREHSWKALGVIREQLREGVTEYEARNFAVEVLADLGVQKHWHKPYLRFGSGTALSFHDPMRSDSPLKPNEPVYIDLGPVWTDPENGLEYEGDVGDTFVFGENPEAEACAIAAREIFVQLQNEWRAQDLNGIQLYQRLREAAAQRGYDLLDRVDGHRLGDFPHTKHSKERLAKIDFHPGSCLWVLEIQLLDRDRRFGAFFEDLLLE